MGKTNQLAQTIIGQTEALAINESSEDEQYIGAVAYDCELTLKIVSEGVACLRGHCMSVSKYLPIGDPYTFTIRGGFVDCELISGHPDDYYYNECEQQTCFTSWVGED